MEQTLGFWVAPLLLIPGMALLVLSTSARYNQLLLHVASKPEHSRLQRQLLLLRYALIALYLGIAVNAVAALLAHILTANEQLAKSIILVLSCGGVACLLIAVVCLIIDTTHSELRHIERPIEGD
jgi:hypothetical protein